MFKRRSFGKKVRLIMEFFNTYAHLIIFAIFAMFAIFDKNERKPAIIVAVLCLTTVIMKNVYETPYFAIPDFMLLAYVTYSVIKEVKAAIILRRKYKDLQK